MNQDNEALVGRCGMYCGACSIYLATIENGELKKEVAMKLGIPEEEVECRGCGSLTERKDIEICDIICCLDTRNSKYCYECERFHAEDCEDFYKIFKSHLEKEGFNLRMSLQRLESIPMERWLAENSTRWICKSCGTPIFLGSSSCRKCGKPLW